MSLHGEMQVVEAEAARQVQHSIECVNDEFVAVAAVGRIHAAVTRGFFDVQLAQQARPTVCALRVVGGGQAFVFGNGGALEVGNQPVRPHKSAGGNGVFVFQNDGKGFRAFGRAADFKGDGVSRHVVRTKLAAAFAVFVFKFAVDNG